MDTITSTNKKNRKLPVTALWWGKIYSDLNVIDWNKGGGRKKGSKKNSVQKVREAMLNAEESNELPIWYISVIPSGQSMLPDDWPPFEPWEKFHSIQQATVIVYLFQ